MLLARKEKKRKRQIRDKWDKVESPEIDPHKYSQLIFDKGAKVNSGAKIVFSSNSA